MDLTILKTMGQIAGIGGLSVGVLLLLFREVIRKNIFPTLPPMEAYRLLRLALLLVWSIALIGLSSWVYMSTRAPESRVTDNHITKSVQDQSSSSSIMDQPKSPSKVDGEVAAKNTATPTQSSEAPTQSSEASILVRADTTSDVSIDGASVARLTEGQTSVRRVVFGEHLVEATIPNWPIHWKKQITVSQSGQFIVETGLQKALNGFLAGTWSWNANHLSNERCPHNMDDVWNFGVSSGDSLEKGQPKLNRLVARFLPMDSLSGCEESGHHSCSREYYLVLKLADEPATLAFNAQEDSQRSQYSTAHDPANSKKNCEQYLPPSQIKGTLALMSEHQLSLKVSGENVDVVLTRK